MDRGIISRWNNYFKNQVKKGYSLSEIKESLLSNGFSEGTIDFLIKEYKKDAKKKRNITIVLFFFVLILVLLGPTLFFQKYKYTGFVVGLEKKYYICPNGSDSNTGLDINNPIKTIAKANTISLSAGDSLLFCRGNNQIWRVPLDAYLTLDNGDATSPTFYGAYGTGDKPQLWGSLNASSTTNWIQVEGNLWQSFSTSYEVGNIIFNIKGSEYTAKREMIAGDLNVQGDFYYNSTNNKILFYSTNNPGDFYFGQGIELATKGNYEGIITSFNSNYITLANFSLKYGGFHGVAFRDSLNISIYDFDVKYIGGGMLDQRYGNCIEFGLNQQNIIVQRNNVSQCFDACYSPQAWTTGGKKNILNEDWSYNIGGYCDYGFEYFNSRTTGGVTHNINVHHNTFVNIGYGFSSGQRTNNIPESHMRLSRSPSGSTDFNVYDNIFYKSIDRTLSVGNTATEWDGANLDLNYNLYYKGTGASSISWMTSQYSNLDSFKLSNGNESNGVQLNSSTLFLQDSYQPLSSSVACTMSSTGSYVGALPCESQPEEEQPTPINHAPTQESPLLLVSDYPNSTTEADLNCYNQSTADQDQDEVINIIRWFRNLSLLDEFENQTTIIANNTEVGDEWVCEITPFDGELYGTSLNSTVIQINAVPEPNINLISCTLTNKNWDEDTTLTNAYDLSDCFNDPLNETLSYNVSGNNSIIISLNQEGLVNLSAPANWSGSEVVVFKAGTINRTVSANTVTLTVNSMTDCGDAVCEAGESCNICIIDCGVCEEEPETHSSGGSGGGGSSSPVIKANKTSPENKGKTESVTQNTAIEVQEPVLEQPSEAKENNTIVAGQVPNTEKPAKVSKAKLIGKAAVPLTSVIIFILSILLYAERHKKRQSEKSGINARPSYTQFDKLIMREAARPLVMPDSTKVSNLVNLAKSFKTMSDTEFKVLKASDNLPIWLTESLYCPEIALLMINAETKEDAYRVLYNVYLKEYEPNKKPILKFDEHLLAFELETKGTPLYLTNGMHVNSLSQLFNSLYSLSDTEFKNHVNENRHVIADWAKQFGSVSQKLETARTRNEMINNIKELKLEQDMYRLLNK